MDATTVKQHPLFSQVLKLKHHNRTDIGAGTITNVDFIVLALHCFGPFGLTEVRELSKIWRGGWELQNYFGPTLGYTGQAFVGKELYGFGFASSVWHREERGCVPFWFRYTPGGKPGKRYTNALNCYGMERLSQLLTLCTAAGFPTGL